ncbi:dTMP kinase [Latilactobacillus fuchuensis]|uniref:Thymidylate kinase n=2 Tax=Latilactobacillus fuchuensis TaxID=164393 RepID=A0A2N9DTP4_9LACO|nr:dTMP kinase [Latilactobacillus fuchuensis]KRL58660.1 tmk protein [Latilactobacillus fuchuensis DSM 14340 = JCM 11249]MCP8857790.1 dTMP kinase [Latilactobacillus fuchuensis]SPC36972.1 thymidylate kinase [Latilactobacillus fuchuensis]
MAGQFITFEGPDGAGKTSVLEAVVPILREMSSKEIVVTREPGGNPISEKIRQVILDVANTAMDDRTEALLYAAARRQHIVEKIQPALAADQIVICDRFVDSSIAYQGAGRSIGETAVAQMNLFATDGLTPDLTLYLDVPSEVGIARIKQHRQTQYDRLDQEKLAFHQKVRQAYLKLAQAEPKRIQTIDATASFEAVVAQCLAVLKQHYPSLFEE